KNNTMVWPNNGSWLNIAYNDNVGVDHNFMTTVTGGDIISIRVDQGLNSAYDTTQWNPAIIYK
ncbi:MAG: hypothetical protein K0S01_4107, partial [Herbinix sp.]|nr:hypothetical protein [Herbinix sp.]